MPIKKSLTRDQHSKMLRTKRSEKNQTVTDSLKNHLPIHPEELLPPASLLAGIPSSHPEPGIQPSVLQVKKNRFAIIVEQQLVYQPRTSAPIVSARVKLTTAMRGLRRQDDLLIAAYLLRLEVLEVSGKAKLEGFQLGPWQCDHQRLEKGSVYLAEPIWAGFQPFSGQVRGRMLIADVERNRLLDLPWNTEAIIPGVEPFLEK